MEEREGKDWKEKVGREIDRREREERKGMRQWVKRQEEQIWNEREEREAKERELSEERKRELEERMNMIKEREEREEEQRRRERREARDPRMGKYNK